MRLYDPEYARRRSTRLKGYDYAQIGAYFVTICTHERALILGDVIDGAVTLNAAGGVVEEEWLRTFAVRPNVDLDAYVVMPNHVHGVIVIRNRASVTPEQPPLAVAQSARQTLGAVVRGFKGAGVRRLGAECIVPSPVWQRNFYEHIIRDNRDLDRIRDYIEQNPHRWSARTAEERGILQRTPIAGAP